MLDTQTETNRNKISVNTVMKNFLHLSIYLSIYREVRIITISVCVCYAT